MICKKASIAWIPKEAGGRSKPPLGIGEPSYATVIHFPEEPWPHLSGSWSLVVRKDEALSSEYHWIANVHFLVEEAPHDSLRDGRNFELYEGNKCVARGSIICEETASIPPRQLP